MAAGAGSYSSRAVLQAPWQQARDLGNDMNMKHEPPLAQAHPPDQQQQQQQPQPQAESHAGQGSESAMKQMRVWEEHRSSHSAGEGRQGAG